MQVWTTKKIKDLLFQSYYDKLFCVDSEFFEIEYIKKAGILDIAVLELTKDYLSFLNNKKLKGIEGVTIFCDSKKNNIEDLSHYNALVLDINKLGVDGCREIITFIINVLQNKYQPILWYKINEIKLEEKERDAPINSKDEVINIISYPQKNNLGVIISFVVEEDGRKVTARGTCIVKDIRQNYFIVEKIKPYFITNGLKEDMVLKIVFPAKNIHYEGLCVLRAKKEDALYLDFPEKLFIERRRHLRVEPSKNKPVYIYVHIPEESSDPFELLDISLQGVAFISERDLSEQGIYTFTLHITETNAIIMATGIIRYKQKYEAKHKYGVEFQITEKDMEKIANYIRKREIEILEVLKQSSTT